MNEDQVRQLIDQAMRAERANSFAEARALLRQAVALGVSQTPLVLNARLRLARLCVRHSLGRDDLAEAELLLHEVREEATRQGASGVVVEAVHLLALLNCQRFQFAAALALLQESPVRDRTDAPTAETAQWWHYRGLALGGLGEWAQGERILHRALLLYQDLGDASGRAEVCNSLASLLVKRGKPVAAIAFAQRGLEATPTGSLQGRAIALAIMGRAHTLQARYAEAEKCLAEALALDRQLGTLAPVGMMLNLLGKTAFHQQNYAAAEKYHRQCLQEGADPVDALYAHIGLAWVALARGALDEAAAECELLERGLQGRNPGRGLEDVADGLRGAIAWRAGQLAEGESRLRRAVTNLTEKGRALDAIPFRYELRDLYKHRQEIDRAVAEMSAAMDHLAEAGAEQGVHDLEAWLRHIDPASLSRLALSQHFPDFLVEGILRGSLTLPEPTTQQVAVLFCDIRDYTTLTEGLRAAEVFQLLNDWYAEATRVIRKHRGVVDKFIGDAVMALFGVPNARDDASADAVRAALELREVLSAMNLRNQALGGKSLRIGVGIDTGDVAVGFLGSHLRQSYTVIGDTVNVASRIQDLTKEHRCDILISAAADAGQARYGVAETEFRGNVTVKGRKQPVAVFQVKNRLQSDKG